MEDPKVKIIPSTPVTSTMRPGIQFHGKTNAQQGVHFEVPTVVYSDPQVMDLYLRLKKVFKDMGHDF